ncbi:MAG: glycoside hydrolase family 32 protein [Planctomycetia bacterium]|nr:glycoside hydrolase family 32 protein [Planctomycetia bacterium]
MKKLFALFVLILLFAQTAKATDDIIFADFEGKDYGAWKTEGTAFGPGPSHGTFEGQMNVSGFQGKGLVNSFYGNDGSKGKLISPDFKIERNFISFLIGGGGHRGTRIDLIVDGKAERTASGPNKVPGGSEELAWTDWDVSDFIGKTATIEIIDEESGFWGHINIDQIIFGNVKKAPGMKSREIVVEKRFFHLPIKTNAPKTWMTLNVEGKPVREFIIELADNEEDADFHALLQVGEWKGKTVKLIAERVSDDCNGLEYIVQSDEMPDMETAYQEKYRPQFHFAPRRGWTNDPNGLMFYKGEYHLFYQHNPFGVTWNNMTWGHAVSPDLLHWNELPDAIEPDELGTIFSGSGVVDHQNTMGVQKGDEKTICGIYTYNGPSMRYGHPASQGLAYSTDAGRTWTKYEKNPIIPHIIGGNRDPKVFWFEPSKCWMMALYMDAEDYAIFSSNNLKDWEKVTDIKNLGCSECPDMFELAVDGDQTNKKWVFWGGNGKYLIGTFDGKTFVKESEPLNMKWGGNDYAAQSYSDTPGRRIQFSWMAGGNYPNMPFNQQFSVPRELTLRSTKDGIRLCTNPVVELELLRGDTMKKSNIKLNKTKKVSIFDDELLDIALTIKVGDADQIEMSIRGQKIVLLPKEKAMLSGDVQAPMAVENGQVELRIVLDRMSIELFANQGLSQIARCFVPEDGKTFDSIEFNVIGDNASIENYQVWKMKSVWK